MSGSRPGHVIRAGVVLVAAVIGLSGCKVQTTVSVLDRDGGSGSVAVSAHFDGQAVDALGGETGLARQLSVVDLARAGWRVSGPVATSGGGAEVSAAHDFSNPAEAARLLAELAGSGPSAGRPFHLTLNTDRGLLHVRNTISGKVDLTCGLSCFGDQGLQSALGNPNGVATAPLLQQAGERPDQLFGFSLSATLPGTVKSDNAPNHDRSALTWTTPLGQATEISATSESLNTGNIILVSVVGGFLVAGMLLALIFRRRRRRASHIRRRRFWPFRRAKERDG